MCRNRLVEFLQDASMNGPDDVVMRKLIVIEFLSADGVMQGLGSPTEDTNTTSAYLFGRRTYQKLAAFWPHQPDSNPMAAHLNHTPKHVATRTLTSVTWEGTRILDDDLPSAVRGLKERGNGAIAVLGSGVLVHQLLLADLVDELRLFIHPLLLGTGKRLFRELPFPRTLELERCSTTSLGTVALRYAVQR